MVIGKVSLTKVDGGKWLYQVIYGRTPSGTGVIDSFKFDMEKQEFRAGNALLYRGISKILIPNL